MGRKKEIPENISTETEENAEKENYQNQLAASLSAVVGG